MRLLFDTQLLVWSARDDEALGAEAAALIDDPANELLFSVASIWEIAIKAGLGHRGLGVEPAVLRLGLLEAGYVEVDVTGAQATAVAGLPPIHKDPFDRLLLAQASVEGLLLLTRDATLARYPGPVRHV